MRRSLLNVLDALSSSGMCLMDQSQLAIAESLTGAK
jgi:hypothetical protein